MFRAHWRVGGHRTALAVLLALALSGGASAQTAYSEAPFEPKLLRLAEILGSLHYLRNLCGEPGSQWRNEMEKLLDAEKPDPARRARLVAGFNHGYRSFDGAYVKCTDSAIEAIRRYMEEGESLSQEIATRFGN